MERVIKFLEALGYQVYNGECFDCLLPSGNDLRKIQIGKDGIELEKKSRLNNDLESIKFSNDVNDIELVLGSNDSLSVCMKAKSLTGNNGVSYALYGNGRSKIRIYDETHFYGNHIFYAMEFTISDGHVMIESLGKNYVIVNESGKWEAFRITDKGVRIRLVEADTLAMALKVLAMYKGFKSSKAMMEYFDILASFIDTEFERQSLKEKGKRKNKKIN